MQADLADFAARHLERAIAEDQLQLYYQPQVTADGQRIVAVEALVRWRHPEAGCIPPSVIIPCAEQTGLIEHLGMWVLKRACRDVHLWPETSPCRSMFPRRSSATPILLGA